ncbi:MAG TPA: GNAT family N-acetyltransferase [Hyphomicrobiaceae bacterium]|nr:GNAT family N-acetyltransferase [Hyphomicrobiaceae bacterium]
MSDAVLDTGQGFVLVRAQEKHKAAVVALQQAAYARNRALLGLEPLPLLADYDEVFANNEVWLGWLDDALAAVLVLEIRVDDVLIWSVATAPKLQGQGLGAALLDAAEVRCRGMGRRRLYLYTGATLQHLVSWYQRHGFNVERIEQLDDRAIAHMSKALD